MVDNMLPSTACDRGSERYGLRNDDQEFDELFQISRPLVESLSSTDSPIGAQPTTDSEDPWAESGRRLEEMSWRIFEYDDLVEDPVVRRTLRLSPFEERTRHETKSCGSQEVSAIPSHLPTCLASPPSYPTTSFELHPQAVVREASKGTPDAINFSGGENPGPQSEGSVIPEKSPTVMRSAKSASYRNENVLSSPGAREESEEQSAQPQVPAQVQPRHGQGELPNFPSCKEQIPAGLSLDEICQDYPNHLIGKHLRAFINAGWSGRRMWSAMRVGAQGSRSRKRPWNKFEHRLLKEKKRMAEEQADQTGGQNCHVPEADMEVSSGSDDHFPHKPVASGHPHGVLNDMRSRAVSDQPVARESTSGSTSSQPGKMGETDNTRPAEGGLETLARLFHAELTEQSEVLSAIISMDDPYFRFKPGEEQSPHIEDEWIRRVKRLERTFASDNNVDADQISIDKTSVGGLLRRLNILVQMSHSALPNPAETAHPGLTVQSDVGRRLATLRQQLQVLRGWTTIWCQQLEESQGRTCAARQ